MRVLTSKKILVVLTVILAVGFSITPAFAQDADPDGAWCRAGWFFDFCSIVNTFILGVPYIMGLVGGFMMTIAAMLTDVFLKMNTAILPDNFGIITAGFKTTLSIANLGFVVALIFIAFATILDLHHHAAQKMLGKLIIAAVLINFSLLIAGVILDFSHVLAQAFLTSGDASSSIASSFNPHNFLIEPPNLKEGASSIPFVDAEWYKIVLGYIVLVVFTWLMFIVMLCVAIALLVRYIYLVILIILMPLAWVSPVLPHFEDVGKDWWHKFLNQVFFLPTLAFFIYLATQTATFLKNDISGQTAFSASAIQAIKDQSIFIGLPQMIIQLLVVTGLLVGGLIAASKTGGIAGKFGVTMGEKIKGAASGVGKGIGKGIYRYSGAQVAKQKGAQLLSTGFSYNPKSDTGKKLRAAADILTLGATRGYGSKALRGALNEAGSPAEDIEAIKKSKFDGLTRNQLEQMAEGSPPLLPKDRAAFVSKLSDEHMLDKIHGKEEAYISALKKVTPGTKAYDIKLVKEIVEHNPFAAQYAPKPEDKEPIDAISRVIRNANKTTAAKWDSSVLKEIFEERGAADFFQLLNNAKITAILSDTDERKRTVVLKAFESFKENSANLDEGGKKRLQEIIKFEKLNPSFQIQSISGGSEEKTEEQKTEKHKEEPSKPFGGLEVQHEGDEPHGDKNHK